MRVEVATVIAAYLVGCLSPSYLIAQRLRGEDIRAVGSGNPGATNVLRTLGRRAAIVVLLLDVAKGAIPVLAARALELSDTAIAAVAVAAVIGHVFPVFLGFRGGKGVATAAGAFGSLDVWALAAAVAVFVVVVAWTRYVSLGSVLAVVLFPLFALGADGLGCGAAAEVQPDRRVPIEWVVGAAGIALLVVYKHRTNLSNLAHGRERKLGERAMPEEST